MVTSLMKTKQSLPEDVQIIAILNVFAFYHHC